MGENLLDIRNLHIEYASEGVCFHAVNGIDLRLEKGETLGLVGETGAGKTTTALGIMNLVPSPPGKITAGEILLEGEDLLKKSNHEMRKIRGKKISMIFQDPMTSLNPVMTVGEQIVEVIRLHERGTAMDAALKAKEMLEMVGIPSERFGEYPHQFSGGMKQRVVISIALACQPELLIADEPTTALDVTIQAQILNLIKRLNRGLDMTTILITHDLGVVATLCDKVVVMYGGLIMEDGTVEEIFYHPKHPYTMGLIDSIPRVTGGEKQRLKPIPGTPPNLIHPPKGCPFSTRCPYCMNVCMEEMPPYFQEDGHRTMCWLLHEEAPVNPEYVQRKEAMRRADG